MLKDLPTMKFILPKEAIFTSIESLAIPKTSYKQELVYKFINHCYEPKNLAAHSEYDYTFPATSDALDLMEEMPDEYYQTFKDVKNAKELQFFRYLTSEDKIRDIWVDVKSAKEY